MQPRHACVSKLAPEAQGEDLLLSQMGFVLLQHSPAWGLPTCCVQCLQVRAYLQLSGEKFDAIDCPSQPDFDELPALEYEDKVAYGNRDGGAIAFLREQRGVDLEAALTEEESSELQAFLALVEKSLAEASSYSQWVDATEDKHLSVAQSGYSATLPWPLSRILALQKAQKTKALFKAANLGSTEVYGRAAEAYSALSKRLAERQTFFAERPTILDAALYAHLIYHLRAPLLESRLRTEIERFPNLVRFAEAMHLRLFGEGAASQPPLFAAPPRRRPEQGRSSAGTSSASTEAKRSAQKRRARYFVLGQILSVVLYLFFSSIQIEEELEDEVDEDEGGSF